MQWQPSAEAFPEPTLKKQCCGEAESQRAVAITKQQSLEQHTNENGDGTFKVQNQQVNGHYSNDNDDNAVKGQTQQSNNGHHHNDAGVDGAVDQDKVLLNAGDCSVSAPVSA